MILSTQHNAMVTTIPISLCATWLLSAWSGAYMEAPSRWCIIRRQRYKNFLNYLYSFYKQTEMGSARKERKKLPQNSYHVIVVLKPLLVDLVNDAAKPQLHVLGQGPNPCWQTSGNQKTRQMTYFFLGLRPFFFFSFFSHPNELATATKETHH